MPPQAAVDVVGDPVAVRHRYANVRFGTQVQYQHWGNATVARSNGDGTYVLDIPAAGARTVRHDEFTYAVVQVMLIVRGVKYSSLSDQDSAREQFGLAIASAVVAESEGKVTEADVLVELFPSSTSEREPLCGIPNFALIHWQSAVMAKVTITPPHGLLSKVQEVLSQSARFGGTVTSAITDEQRSLNRVLDKSTTAPLETRVKSIGVVFASALIGSQPPQVYEDQPEFCCFYYNADDPRSILCGRDECQCGQASLAANLANYKGKCLFFSLFVLPVLMLVAIIILIAINVAG